MKRRMFLRQISFAALLTPLSRFLDAGAAVAESSAARTEAMEPQLARDWLQAWEQHILAEERNRYCDTELGEELGWKVSPFLNGFFNGFRATRDPKWLERLTEWGDAWTRRGIKEPDGFIGWPKASTGGSIAEELYTDSLLGEAMALRPLVLMPVRCGRIPA